MENIISEIQTINEKMLKEMIDNIAKTINQENHIIYDGTAYPEKYYNSTPKTMWILKEAYEENGKYGWNVGYLYNPISSKHSKTARKLALVVYAVINKCTAQEALNASNKDLEEAYKSMARLNINKIAAGKTSPLDMSPQYNIWRSVLLKQIEIYNPDIIIGGNTLKYFAKDIGFNNAERKSIGMKNRYYWLHNGKLYMDVFHPSKPFLNMNDYLSKIIVAIEDWRNSKEC